MRSVDFYFDFSSTNSYFAAFMLPETCKRCDARVNWLPIHLAAIFRGTGFDVMAMPAGKARYLWRDHQRYAEFTGLPFRRPRRFPIKTAAALRAMLVASRAGRAAEFTQEGFRAYWERDEDLSDPAVLLAIAERLALDREEMSAGIDSPAVRGELAAITERAVARGVFGAPTFFVGEEMFWGKDRLDFVARWLNRLPSR